MTVAPTPIPRRRTWGRELWLILALAALAVGITLFIRHDVFQGGSSSGSLQGSGVAATETRSVPAFNAIELAGANVVTVAVGTKQSVTVRADSNLVGRVTTTVHRGALVVSQRGSFTTRSPMSVDVTVPSIHSITLSGSGVLAVERVKSPRLYVRVPGNGVVTVAGIVTRLDVRLGGSGDVRLGDLTARDVAARVSGSGRLIVHATGTLGASISGSGAIFYTGNPVVTQSITGSGVVIHR